MSKNCHFHTGSTCIWNSFAYNATQRRNQFAKWIVMMGWENPMFLCILMWGEKLFTWIWIHILKCTFTLGYDWNTVWSIDSLKRQYRDYWNYIIARGHINHVYLSGILTMFTSRILRTVSQTPLYTWYMFKGPLARLSTRLLISRVIKYS